MTIGCVMKSLKFSFTSRRIEFFFNMHDSGFCHAVNKIRIYSRMKNHFFTSNPFDSRFCYACISILICIPKNEKSIFQIYMIWQYYNIIYSYLLQNEKSLSSNPFDSRFCHACQSVLTCARSYSYFLLKQEIYMPVGCVMQSFKLEFTLR